MNIPSNEEFRQAAIAEGGQSVSAGGPPIRKLPETTVKSEPYSPGFFGFKNVMRGVYAPWVLLCTFIGLSGFLWQRVIGFPNWAEPGAMMSGSAGFIRNADPLLWWISFAVMAATIGSFLLANVLYFASGDTVPKNPRSKIYGKMHYAMIIGYFLLFLLIAILGY